MNLPTEEECRKMWDEVDLPENIRQHILCVRKIAVFLARELGEKGEQIDVELVEKAALLHDIDKMHTLGENNHKHGTISYDILLKKGYPEELAKLIKFHRFETDDEISKKWELKVLRYADCRSLGDEIVSVDERFEYLRGKYPNLKKEENGYIEPLMRNVEKEICEKIGIKPEELKEKI